jgi:hypothetical protein
MIQRTAAGAGPFAVEAGSGTNAKKSPGSTLNRITRTPRAIAA